jgi:trehalose 6-phosphate synthase
VIQQHYEAIGVRVMLWLFHYLFDTSRLPVFDGGLSVAWTGYEAVNRAYAEYLPRLMTNSPEEFVLINDYHLFLVPELLGPRASRHSQVGFFHGLPWCEPHYFGILPGPIRDRILRSLLRCDVVGFHCTPWARAFLACCVRFLPDCEVRDEGVAFQGTETRVVVAPFPLDTHAVERMRDESSTARWEEQLRAIGGGRRVIARADRIDLWKNLPRGFAAYRSLLERRPGLADEWWFCAVATPPSRTTEQSRDLQRLCAAMVADINERFGLAGRPAVSLVRPELATSRNCVVAALSDAKVTLVNPTFDGLNLVAKEALFLGDSSQLVLSVNAGVYEQLASYVTPVHPFDVEATSAAVLQAMGDEGAARQRVAEGRMLLQSQDAGDWLAELRHDEVRMDGA